jgi:hypothetical protein
LVIDNGEALESVIRHAQLDEIDYDDIALTVDALTGSGDISLAPRLHEALARFLDEENFYGRDLIAGILAGIEGVAALPALLLASARDLGDDQDSLQAEIAGLLDADPEASRRMCSNSSTTPRPSSAGRDSWRSAPWQNPATLNCWPRRPLTPIRRSG